MNKTQRASGYGSYIGLSDSRKAMQFKGVMHPTDTDRRQPPPREERADGKAAARRRRQMERMR